jgi:endonuclease/exonuclease/phosphatase family metal-dependent hydrolase
VEVPIADGPTRLRVMSFNVRGFSSPVDGRLRWSRRAGLNADVVRRWAPDVLGVQELQAEALATYRERLPGYGLVLGPTAGTRRRPEYNAILYDRDRLEVLDAEGFWLSETPEVPSTAWGSRNVRTAHGVTFAVRGTGVIFRHVNTHLDHWSALARARGVELLLRRTDGDLPTVVTGDFNCPADSAPHRSFLAEGFEDTHLAVGGGGHRDEATFHGFGGVRSRVVRSFHRARNGRAPLRLDWILVGGPEGAWSVEASAIVRDRDPATGAPPSDHDPVVADLRLEGPQRPSGTRQ